MIAENVSSRVQFSSLPIKRKKGGEELFYASECFPAVMSVEIC